VSYLFFTNEGLYEDDYQWYTDLDLKIYDWCTDHFELGVIQHAELPDASCYVELTDNSWDGSETGYMLIYVDVTAQRDMRHMVNAAFVGIALLGSLAAGLAGWGAGRRIEDAQAAQKRFFENMSHELKTPLAAISGYAEGIEEGVLDTHLATSRIIRASEHMRGIVDEIMDLSRLEAGAVTLTREHVDVGQFVQDCLMPFEDVARTRSLVVELDLAEGTMEVDADLFAHALENVCSNAFRHAGTLVRIAYDGTTLKVANDGDIPGKQEVSHIFERFHTSARSTGGTGIGLALTKEICELHGITLTATIEGDQLVITFDLG
jgi:signal transduction histidine kinase